MNTRQFVVLIDTCDAETRDAITDYFVSLQVDWWHRLAYAWLIADSEGKVTVRQITDKLAELAPGVHHLSFEIGSLNGWAGCGPGDEEREERGARRRNMFNWLRTNFVPGQPARSQEKPAD